MESYFINTPKYSIGQFLQKNCGGGGGGGGGHQDIQNHDNSKFIIILLTESRIANSKQLCTHYINYM